MGRTMSAVGVDVEDKAELEGAIGVEAESAVEVVDGAALEEVVVENTGVEDEGVVLGALNVISESGADINAVNEGGREGAGGRDRLLKSMLDGGSEL